LDAGSLGWGVVRPTGSFSLLLAKPDCRSFPSIATLDGVFKKSIP
jgi:hypothetical protein